MKTQKKQSKKSKLEWDDPEEEFSWDTDETPTKASSKESVETSQSAGSGPSIKKPLSKFSLAILKKQSPFALTPNQPSSEARLTGKKGRRGGRMLTITLDANSKDLNPSDMIREVIACKNIIDDRYDDPEFCSKLFYRMGNIPAYILAGDRDRFYQWLFAAETLRLNPEFKNHGVDELSRTDRNKDYDASKHQPELDGTVWGGVEPVQTPKTVRDQMAQSKKDNIEKTREDAKPAKVYDPEKDTYYQRWKMAEARARIPRKEWEGKTDAMFEAMIKYCYGWLRDIGEVPQPYPDPIDLFWQRPRPGSMDMSVAAVEARTKVTGKIIKFLHSSMSQPGVREKMELGRKPLSYRVVLAAKNLATKIEWYCNPDPIHGKDIDTVKKVALDYFNAHFPIDTQGAKPGPLETLDPGYVDYIRICRTYGLDEGTLLHEADL